MRLRSDQFLLSLEEQAACGNPPDFMPERITRASPGAIAMYNKLLDFVKDKDPITYHMVLEILEDEVEHEEDLEAILQDIETPID